jgi:hypothetical protein
VLGTLDFIQGVAQSCNVYFYTLGGGFGNIQGLGSARLGQYAQLLGYGTSTGIDVPSETRGRVPNPEWKRAQFGEDWLPLYRDSGMYDLYTGDEAVHNGREGVVAGLRRGYIINYTDSADGARPTQMGFRHQADKLERRVPFRPMTRSDE